jgi:hypothetical protein
MKILEYRKLIAGLAMGLPYLWSSHAIIMAAIAQGRDLTATGVAVGSVSVGVCGILGIFVAGNVLEHRARVAGGGGG